MAMMGRSALLRVALGLGLVLAATSAAGQTPARPTRRSVVILYSIPPDVPGLPELTTGVTEILQKGSSAPVDIYSEYTGLDRFSGAAYETSLLSLYNEKYAARKVDLVIAVGATALGFAVAHKFLPDVPLVTCYVGRSFIESARLQRPEVTGALPPQNAPRTLELMLSM